MTTTYWTALTLCATTLAVAPGLGAQAAGPAADNQGRTYRLSGLVTDAAREPLAEVEVRLISPMPERVATTDTRGRFDLGEFSPGAVALRVRRVGFEQRVLNIQVGAGDQASTTVEVALIPVVQELEEVYVGAATEGRMREFSRRREQRGPFARFLDAGEIRRLGPVNTSDLFRSVPGILIQSRGGGGNTIRIRNCQPMVRIDGQRVPGAELDEVAQPDDIAGIEFYPSAAGVPAQYVERTNRLCGLILVWTKTE